MYGVEQSVPHTVDTLDCPTREVYIYIYLFVARVFAHAVLPPSNQDPLLTSRGFHAFARLRAKSAVIVHC